MSDQTAVQDPKQLAQSRFAAVKLPVEILPELVAIETYVIRFVGLNRPLEYVKKMLALKNQTLSSIDETINVVGEAVATALGKLADNIAQETGTEMDPNKPLKPAVLDRLEKELKEHGFNIEDSKEIINTVTTLGATLQVTYSSPSVLSTPAVPLPDSATKWSGLKKLVSPFIDLETEKTTVTMEPDVEHGDWQTESILPEAKKAFDDLETVKQTVGMYPDDVAEAKTDLATFGNMDGPALSQLFTNCIRIATEQITLSTQIKDIVTKQAQAWVAESEGYEAILNDLGRLQAYIHPSGK